MNIRNTLVAAVLAVCLCSGAGAAEAPTHVSLHSWVVYWDEGAGWQEWQAANAQRQTYDDVSYFAVSFDEDGKFHLPEGFGKQGKMKTYLTVVNDVIGADKTLVKDRAVLQRLLADKKAQQRHSEDLLALAKRGGYDGIEIDYEQVFRDEKLIPLYTSFLKILYQKAKAQHLPVRVVIEPKMAAQIKGFPQGPTYVVMAYNLYGLHSGPGPKADFAFIRKTIGQLKTLPKPWGIAFSTGGCLWGDDGTKKFISTPTALRLAADHGKQPLRDALSGALSFSYRQDGVTYTVWYADEETIQDWMRKAQSYGIDDISVWRLGEHERAYTFSGHRKGETP